ISPSGESGHVNVAIPCISALRFALSAASLRIRQRRMTAATPQPLSTVLRNSIVTAGCDGFFLLATMLGSLEKGGHVFSFGKAARDLGRHACGDHDGKKPQGWQAGFLTHGGQRPHEWRYPCPSNLEMRVDIRSQPVCWPVSFASALRLPWRSKVRQTSPAPMPAGS